MEKLFNYLKENLKEWYCNIKIVDLIYKKNSDILTVDIIYKPEFEFLEQHKQHLTNLIKNFLNISNLKIKIKYRKSLLDEQAIKEVIKKYLNEHFASVCTTMQTDDICVNIADNIVDINLFVIDAFIEYLTNKNIEKLLQEHLLHNYFSNFNVSLSLKECEDINLQDVLKERELIVERQIASSNVKENIITYKLIDAQHFIGKKIENDAITINCIKANECDVVVSGEVSFLTKKTFVSKRKSSEGEEREYLNFMLSDGIDKIYCVYFPTKETINKIDEIKDGMYLAAIGDTEEFNGKSNFKVKGLAYCEKPNIELQIESREENKDYIYVEPEEYLNLSQANLFDVILENKNKFLQDNDVVVFDVETTGLEASTCEIIEIGAVKVRDGKIVETFSTLVKPKKEIPPEITKLNGITNDMVKNALTINEVLQDFYKFTRGSVLAAYNIAFDYKFIYLAGTAQGYVFENKQIDVMVLAKTKLKGLKNYKLKTVVAELIIPLENAHRAINDAIATAEAFIKLVDSDTKL